MTTTTQWQAQAEQLLIRSKAWINGEDTDAINGNTFDCISPVDGRRLAQIASCDKADVDRALTKYTELKSTWIALEARP